MESKIYSIPQSVSAEYANMKKVLSTSAIYTFFQTLAVEHAAKLGYGDTVLRPKNLIWMVVHMRTEVLRLPHYLEELSLNTWTGKSSHGLYIRNYEICTKDGEPLVRGIGTWVLVDLEDRVMRQETECEFENVVTGREMRSPRRLRLPGLDQEQIVSVPFGMCDVNGHLNNVRYLELAENLLPIDYLTSHTLQAADVDYLSEVLPGEDLHIQFTQQDNVWFFQGSTDHPCFQIRLSYE